MAWVTSMAVFSKMVCAYGRVRRCETRQTVSPLEIRVQNKDRQQRRTDKPRQQEDHWLRRSLNI